MERIDSCTRTVFALCYREIESEADTREGLGQCSADVVSALCQKFGSLRKAAAAVGLSPAYLSRVGGGNLPLGPHRFVKLFRIAYPETARDIERSRLMAEWLETPEFGTVGRLK